MLFCATLPLAFFAGGLEGQGGFWQISTVGSFVSSESLDLLYLLFQRSQLSMVNFGETWQTLTSSKKRQ